MDETKALKDTHKAFLKQLTLAEAKAATKQQDYADALDVVQEIQRKMAAIQYSIEIISGSLGAQTDGPRKREVHSLVRRELQNGPRIFATIRKSLGPQYSPYEIREALSGLDIAKIGANQYVLCDTDGDNKPDLTESISLDTSE